MYLAYDHNFRREVNVPVFPEDEHRPPEQNEILFHSQGEAGQRETEAELSCHLCEQKLGPSQPRWEILRTPYRICQPCTMQHRIFLGEPLKQKDKPPAT